jgi:hypothetical protein
MNHIAAQSGIAPSQMRTENSGAHQRTSISMAPLAGLYALFVLIAFGLGYPTLNRFDPRQVIGLSDVKIYAEMVTGSPQPKAELTHMRYRVLVPWIARAFYRVSASRIGSWDPVLFSLLAANSLFIAGTALLIVVIGTRFLAYPVALVGALLYLVNFAVPNLRLVGLVDAGEAFWLLALYWTLLNESWWLLPAVAVLGAMAKESFVPFSFVFTAAWWVVARKELPSAQRALRWIGISWLFALGALLTVHKAVGGHLEHPLVFAAQLRGNNHYFGNFLSSIWDRNVGYVFIWLFPLGVPRLTRFPRTWLIPTAAASILAVILDVYYTGAYGTLARALFTTTGPLLALSCAALVAEVPVRGPLPFPQR